MPVSRVPRGSAGALLAGLLLALVACRASLELNPPRAAALRTAEPLQVTLASSLRGWKETTDVLGPRTRFRLGTLFERLFPARDGRSFLSPLEAHLDTSWNATDSAWDSRYTFVLSLQRDGVYHAIRAEGRGSSRADPREADRAALEGCVAEIYTQVARLLADEAR